MVGETVYLYRPVVTPGKTVKFVGPWVGPFIISKKLSEIHMKIRRVQHIMDHYVISDKYR